MKIRPEPIQIIPEEGRISAEHSGKTESNSAPLCDFRVPLPHQQTLGQLGHWLGQLMGPNSHVCVEISTGA